MPRLVVYVRSRFCPDVGRWRRWRDRHELEVEELDIDADPEAHARLLALTGHESVPTLVIASCDSVEPVEPPSVLPPGRSPRAVDRGTVLTEPNPGQIAPFLERHGIPFAEIEGADLLGR